MTLITLEISGVDSLICKLDELVAGGGERKASYEGKKNPGDFAVWKFKKEGEPSWGSPWGEGRPGWHIECSAMIKQHLSDTIDIHGGGQDLIFPHHENEIAQSEAANGCPLANFWVHNAFVNIDGEKMSKSLGNFFTIRDIVKKYPYNVIRFFILLGHYRSPINFSDELLAAAQTSLGRISNCVSQVTFALENGADSHPADSETSKKLMDAVKAAEESFIGHMDDDLNSADAITDIFNLVTETNKALAADDASVDSLKAAQAKLVELTGVLGVKLDEAKEEIPAEVMELAEKRAEAKKAKDFALADSIRDQITALGYSIKDTPKGPQLEKLK